MRPEGPRWWPAGVPSNAEEAQPTVLVDLVGGNVGGLLNNAPPVVLQEGLGAARTAGGGPALIDTPPHTSDAALTAGREADLIIIPCQPATADLHGISTTIDRHRTHTNP